MAETASQTVDLTNCDREPIHTPGSIQPHGCLLVCDPEAVVIRRYSSNAAAFLGLPDQELSGRRLEEVIGGTPTFELRNALARSGTPSRAGLMPNLRLQSGRSFDVSVHRYGDNALLEFESPEDIGPSSPLEFARTLIGRFARKAHVRQIVRDGAKLLRAVLQYDRVMIYRFAEDGSGQVIAEAKRSDLESFSGQHFPASDIPMQARRLYLLNPIRVVFDACGVRVPVVPDMDEAGTALDMSYAHLRSVSPIHCEYLRNMGVAASMSISVIVGGQLWGLIACHHYVPRSLSMSQRIAAEIFGEFFSLQLETQLERQKLAVAERARVFFEHLLDDDADRPTGVAFLADNLAAFSSFIPSDGMGMWLDGRWSGHGSTPPESDIAALVDFLSAEAGGKVWSTHELRRHVPAAQDYLKLAAGALAVPLSQQPGDYLFFFRREVVQTVEWGGDPNKTYATGPHGDRLTPRRSFAIWKQTVEGQSNRWTQVELQLAETARAALNAIVQKARG